MHSAEIEEPSSDGVAIAGNESEIKDCILTEPELFPLNFYSAKLKSSLPAEAFEADNSRLWILLINMAILVLGWLMARILGPLHWYSIILLLPFVVIMGNSVLMCLFCSHDILHTNVIKNKTLRWLISLLGLSLFWMPPSLWKVLHNREHHGRTNSVNDPDRNYLFNQKNTWGKWIQNKFVPSSEVNPFLLAIGMTQSWGIHAFRNLSSILLFNDGVKAYPASAFKVQGKVRLSIALETILIGMLHFCIIVFLGFDLLKILLLYFVPIWLGHCAAMIYIYSNHLLCPMSTINDPLYNSISVRVPWMLDLLHLNFSHHVEHHIFPHVRSDYYPKVRDLLLSEYPDRFHLLPIGEVWSMLLKTPRHYLDSTTFTDSAGTKQVPCPLR
jgi:fatty acid desaturase